jgi:hypothetical protein
VFRLRDTRERHAMAHANRREVARRAETRYGGISQSGNLRPETASTLGALRAVKSLHKRSFGGRGMSGAPARGRPDVPLSYLCSSGGLACNEPHNDALHPASDGRIDG